MSEDELEQRLATLWRVESPRVIARLMRQVGDLDTAEELAQDVFVAALEKWRQDGVPDNPAAWLNTTARFLAVDRIRRRDTQRGKYQLVAASQPASTRTEPRRDRRRRSGRRPARADLHGLPPDPVTRCALCAHPQARLRPEHRRGRPGVPDSRADDRPAHRTGQAHARRGEGAVRAAPRVGAAGTAGCRTRGHLSGLQRGLLGHQWRPVVPRRSVRGGASARPDAGRADADPTPRRSACLR